MPWRCFSRFIDVSLANIRLAQDMKEWSNEFSDDAIKMLIDLLTVMVAFEPEDRLPIETVLKHPAIFLKKRKLNTY
jgi:hypothetical protein